MTTLSRVMGLLRDIVIANVFGASANADAFFVAFKIPNFLRRLFAEGAFSQAFVPVLAEYKAQGSAAAVKELVNRVAGVLGGSLLFVTGIAILAAPLITMIFAPGFISHTEKFTLTTEMIRITFPYLFLISMTGFCGAILNSYGRFAVPAFTPFFLNLSLIVSALVAAPWFDEPVFALAWGVLLAGIVQLLFQLPSLYRLDLLPCPVWNTSDKGVRRILKLMVPALFGVSVSQINLLLDTVLASFFQTGSVSWLYYSDRLTELPLGIFGIAIATVILPNLSAHRAAAREEHFSATLDWAMRWVLLIGVPSTLALIVLAEPILITLFQYGALTSHDVNMSALSLRALSLGLLAFMLIKVLAPGFYAHTDTATPVKIGITAMVANMVMNLMFALPLMYLFNIGHMGLALATSLAAMLNAGLLLRGLLRAGYYRFQPGWARYALRLMLASVSMLALILALAPEVTAWYDWRWPRRVFELALLCGVGVAVYSAALWLLGTRMRHLLAPPSH
jgi:putative peptidoglycan lipid II flippase